jgi:hypothetical protein
MTWKDILKGDYKREKDLDNMLNNSGLPIEVVRKIKDLIDKIENEHLKEKENLEAKNKELEAKLKE